MTHLSTLVCDQGSKWLGVEAAVAESQAAVHTVGSQLQSLLTNVILMDRQTQIRPNRFHIPLKTPQLDLIGYKLSQWSIKMNHTSHHRAYQLFGIYTVAITTLIHFDLRSSWDQNIYLNKFVVWSLYAGITLFSEMKMVDHFVKQHQCAF